MSVVTVGATWVGRGTTAASKAARAMWMDVHHGELARCVEAALAAVAPLIAKAERERCAELAEAERHNTAMLTSLPPQSAAAVKIAAAIRALGDAT